MVKNIGMVGDSIAYGCYDEQDLGWFVRLGKKILSSHSGEYVFNNMSQSGDNIADVANRANFEVLSRQFNLIIVNIGINDLRRRKDSKLQLDFSEGARIMYWNKLLDILGKTGATIVVTDLTPVIENRYTEQASLIRYNTDVERYNEIIKHICQQRNIRFFERYGVWKNRELEKFYKDATHPNAKGHQIMAEEMYDYLEKENLL
ncbi:MAG: SGNH/GDSL hydrolase family protein [Alphaproteobacteria bacterium]|nr:SGNH/GDSL hydrolase family protein [Alphaproteobacteria bacterium]